jgi:hypothetical protein
MQRKIFNLHDFFVAVRRQLVQNMCISLRNFKGILYFPTATNYCFENRKLAVPPLIPYLGISRSVEPAPREYK